MQLTNRSRPAHPGTGGQTAAGESPRELAVEVGLARYPRRPPGGRARGRTDLYVARRAAGFRGRLFRLQFRSRSRAVEPQCPAALSQRSARRKNLWSPSARHPPPTFGGLTAAVSVFFLKGV